MKRNKTKLTLVVAANPKAYSGKKGGMWAKELAGSVIAHYLHLWKQQKEKNDNLGVFFTCGFGHDGIAKFLGDLKSDEKDELMKNFGTSVNNLQISKYGYFYESGDITWRFKADGLRTYDEIKSEKLESYLPHFQKYGIEERKRKHRLESKGREWLLIRELKKLKEPVSKEKNGTFKDFKIQTRNALPHSLKIVYPNAYVTHTKKYLTKGPGRFEDIISDELFDVFSGEKKLREEHIHKIFLYHLIYYGHPLTDEGRVESGRFDVAYTKKDGTDVFVEFKLDRGKKDVITQLEGYIKHYFNKRKEKNKDIKKCKRVIICKESSPELLKEIKNMQKKGYNYSEPIEYKLKIIFPNIFDMMN